MTQFQWFLLQLVLFALPLWLAAWAWRAYPHRRVMYLLLIPAVLCTLPILAEMLAALGGLIFLLFNAPVPPLPGFPLVWGHVAFWGTVIGVNGFIALIVFIDLFTLPKESNFAVERQAGRIASLQKKHPVVLTITNTSRIARSVWISDDLPEDWDVDPREFQVVLQPRSRATVHYELSSRRRGAFKLQRVYLVANSRLGLWRRFFRYPIETVINVYPDLKQVSQYALLARLNRLSLLGVRKSRRVGGDNEFERLRDYTRDDNYKHIDWRSTARRGKLTVKDFQTEQSQRVMFLLDCGRMMTNEAAGLALLDHALNAMLMLSYVALSHGDQVGLLTFSDEIHGYVPPAGGRNHINRLLHESFDRFPRLVESRYDKAFLYLASHCQKRTMVVLITNLIDDVNGNQVEQYLTALTGRHLPLAVLLRDRRVFGYAEKSEPVGSELFQAAAAAEILLWRNQVLFDLQKKGVLSLDVFPEDLTAPLINQYLSIKARHLL